MAFLTKKEQSLIRAINADKALTSNKKTEMIQEISHNASLRQEGWRLPVREFIQALAEHQSNKILKTIS